MGNRNFMKCSMDIWRENMREMRKLFASSWRTPMNEGDFSKRDAFVLLDADYPIIMETNQSPGKNTCVCLVYPRIKLYYTK
jgi:hypothetical protein